MILERLKRLGIGPRALPAPQLRPEAPRYRRLAVHPLSPAIGAEISGVDLREPLDDETFAEVRRAFLDWKVIFFREQDVTAEQHVAFARRFGALEVHPFLPSAPGCPEVVVFAKDDRTKGVENIWHSDVSWREKPALGAVLRAREVPALGGDTLFADMEAAFAGRKLLYVNAFFTSHIVGLAPDESEELLELLCRRAWVPEYQCRFRWQKDSIAVWDNRAVQHYAASDYHPARRVMERVSIVGDRPY